MVETRAQKAQKGKGKAKAKVKARYQTRSLGPVSSVGGSSGVGSKNATSSIPQVSSGKKSGGSGEKSDGSGTKRPRESGKARRQKVRVILDGTARFNERLERKRIGNNYYPIYADEKDEGAYQADTFFMRIKDQNGKNATAPFLLLIHINSRIAFVEPYENKYVKNAETADPTYGSSKNPTRRISTGSASAANALKKIRERLDTFIDDAIVALDNDPNQKITRQKVKEIEKLLTIKHISFDEGSEFKRAFRDYCKENGIRLYTFKKEQTTKRSTGLVERLVRTLKNYNTQLKIEALGRGAENTRLNFRDTADYLHRTEDAYNFEERHRSIAKFFDDINEEPMGTGIDREITPVVMLRKPLEYNNKMIKRKQQRTRAVFEHWEEVVNKALTSDERPKVMVWKDRDKFATKESENFNLGPRVGKGEVHFYERRHDGQQEQSVHAPYDNQPVEFNVDGTIHRGTARSFKFSKSDPRRYLPYDLKWV